MPNKAMRALFKNYSEEDGMDIRFLGTGNGVRYFVDFVQNGNYYADDAPDMMLKKGNEVIIIEHADCNKYRWVPFYLIILLLCTIYSKMKR